MRQEAANGHPPYSEETHLVAVTAEERRIGIATKHVFDDEIKRGTPWLTQKDRVTIFKKHSAMLEIGQGTDRKLVRSLTAEDILFEEVAQETISDRLADVIRTFKRIEDKLSDFSLKAAEGFRNYWGISNSYYQWSREENEHSNVEAFILRATGQSTEEEIDDDYIENLEKTWEQPFTTPRQIILYAYFQELLTSHNYRAVGARAEEEGAPKVGRLMRIVSKDEMYHKRGYGLIARVFAEEDLQGTINDAVYVAMNFRMPAMHLMRDLKQNSLDIARIGAFSKDMVAKDTLGRGLRNLGFVPEELCAAVENDYWSNQTELAKAI